MELNRFCILLFFVWFCFVLFILFINSFFFFYRSCIFFTNLFMLLTKRHCKRMPSAKHYHSGPATSSKNFSYQNQNSAAPSSVTWNVQTNRASSSTISWWTRYTSTALSAVSWLCLRRGQQQFASKIAVSNSITSYPCSIQRTRLKCSTWARWSLDLCSCVRVIVCLRNDSCPWWPERRNHFCWSS